MVMNSISIFIVLLITIIITIIYNFTYIVLLLLLNATRGAYLSLGSSQPVYVGRAKSPLQQLQNTHVNVLLLVPEL